MTSNDTLRLALAILATYRLAELISQDDGPYNCIADFRAELGRRGARDGGKWAMFAELVNCPYCIGLWLALFAAIAFVAHFRLLDFALLIFAIGGGQSVLESLTSRNVDNDGSISTYNTYA